MNRKNHYEIEVNEDGILRYTILMIHEFKLKPLVKYKNSQVAEW